MKNRPSGLWHIALILVGLTMIAPLALMVRTALGTSQIGLSPGEPVWHVFFPTQWRWHNFYEVWHRPEINFLRYYFNSLFVAVTVTAGQVLTSASAAYAFARMRWPGRERVFLIYLATMMVPPVILLIPQFALLKEIPRWVSAIVPWIDWSALRYVGSGPAAHSVGRLMGLDSYFALIVPTMFSFSAFGTFLLRQFFLTIPRELDEAALMDGATHRQIFFAIILPLAGPGLTTLALFTFMWTWGSLLWPVVVTSLDSLRTLPLGLMFFQYTNGTQWHYVMAASLLILLPVVIVFLIGQRAFVRGLTVGAVKG